MAKQKHVITVGVYGGLVQWIKGIPKSICVVVRDYDVDGTEPECLTKDEDGRTRPATAIVGFCGCTTSVGSSIPAAITWIGIGSSIYPSGGGWCCRSARP